MRILCNNVSIKHTINYYLYYIGNYDYYFISINYNAIIFFNDRVYQRDAL